MKSYRELEIYEYAKKLAIEIHQESLQFPKHELYEEGSQLRRSSKAVASAIVEGYARRRYKADFVKYLVYSHAECDETILHIEFVYETGSLKSEERFLYFKNEYQILSKKINKFIRYVEDNWNEFPQE